MEPRPNSSFLPYLTSAISLFILGFGAAAIAIFALTPTVWARWLLFFGGTLGLTSLALPVTWFLNLRFPSEPPASPYVVLRQAIWVGVYGVVLAWLQQVRLVTIWTALGLALGLVAMSTWCACARKPAGSQNHCLLKNHRWKINHPPKHEPARTPFCRTTSPDPTGG
jgi:hypothetical protein